MKERGADIAKSPVRLYDLYNIYASQAGTHPPSTIASITIADPHTFHFTLYIFGAPLTNPLATALIN